MAPLSAKEAANLEEMQDDCELLERTGPAFAMLIVEHLNAGEAAATEAIEKFPKSYLGYRVAADFYRLMEDWPAFTEMLAAAKKRNPDSNGLRFLKGAEAFQNKKDRAAATAFYKDALAKDPGFVRAQSHLLMIQPDVKGLHTELERLRKLNPQHQIVAWVGTMIDQAYDSWKQRNGFLAN
jgi:tetratricopeptide (TPR) repeat protein